MQYKTIVLQSLRQRPVLHNQLKGNRTLLPSLDLWAKELKALHEARKEELSQERPGSDASQIAAEALEMALADWTNSLPPESTENEEGLLSLDGAMAYLRRPTPPA
jgi:hypothetical protein